MEGDSQCKKTNGTFGQPEDVREKPFDNVSKDVQVLWEAVLRGWPHKLQQVPRARSGSDSGCFGAVMGPEGRPRKDGSKMARG